MWSAFMLFAKGALGILARVPWYVWPMVILLWWGAAGRLALHSERADRDKEKKAQVAALAKTQQDADKATNYLKGQIDEQKRAKQAELDSIAAALERAQRELRNRGPRRTELPGPPAPACVGATGAELSEPDGRFLVGEAARANRLRAAYAQCQAWAEAVKKQMDALRKTP